MNVFDLKDAPIMLFEDEHLGADLFRYGVAYATEGKRVVLVQRVHRRSALEIADALRAAQARAGGKGGFTR